MNNPRLEQIRDLIQEDVGQRGLRSDPADNLITRTAEDFATACWSIASHPKASVCVVTGFFIPQGQPPACETDGPLGAIFLARALSRLQIPVMLVADQTLASALDAGLDAANLFLEQDDVDFICFDPPAYGRDWLRSVLFADEPSEPGWWTHFIALERVGPSHTPASVVAQRGTTPEMVDEFRQLVPHADWDRYHTMRGRDITDCTGPLHLLFGEAAARKPYVTTIGIGDGGNEIGMGKLPWDVIRRNIPNGAQVACRVPTDHLIVAGVSNWGAYGLAAGVRLLRGAPPDPELFDPERERELLRVMVERGPLVDGVTGQPTVSVDGLDFDRYIEPLRKLAAIR